MKVLLVGGTGLISVGIVEALLERGANVTMFNRGERENRLPGAVALVKGDRNRPTEFEDRFRNERFDVVIDMICFTPAHAEATVRAFGGRCEQLLFCSTVCTYGVEISPRVLIDETFEQRPISGYGRDKVECERIFLRAQEQGRFQTTIVRPSNTYGPGASLIDQMEFDSVVWDRVLHGLPVLCAGDGIGLWQSTHRRDVGRFFAHAAANPKTYGESYNAVREHVFTWRDYYREAAAALDTRAELVLVPAGWVIAKNRKRFSFLEEITRYHGAYSAAKARAHVPEFTGATEFTPGARETFADIRRRGAWKEHTKDREYDALVREALAAGFERITA